MIELESVEKVYPGPPPVTALHGVTLSIGRNDFVGIVGPSGSGKSTLLNLIGCLDVPSSGRCRFLDVDTSKLDDRALSRLRNRSIGFVFQLFNLVPELTVRENIELPLVYAGVVSGRRVRIESALEQVGMLDRADHRAGLLSGGEQQRAAIARALVNDPELILADEPTGSIDAESGRIVLQMLDDLHRAGRTIVVVTHNPWVARAARRTVRIAGGTVAEDSDPALPRQLMQPVHRSAVPVQTPAIGMTAHESA